MTRCPTTTPEFDAIDFAQRSNPRKEPQEDTDGGDEQLALERRDDNKEHVDTNRDRQHPIRPAGRCADWRRVEQQDEPEDDADHDSIDGGSTLGRPIDILEAEDERELVQHQYGPGPEAGGEKELPAPSAGVNAN